MFLHIQISLLKNGFYSIFIPTAAAAATVVVAAVVVVVVGPEK